MLSPGKWHELVPRDQTENLLYRRWLYEQCKDKTFRQGVLEICKQDILFYINSFVWQYNPKRVGQEVEPFITWDFQDGVILRTIKRLFDDQRSMVWEKSRELGATWAALIVFDWACLFQEWKTFLAISHSEEAVDKPGKRNTLFWKLDFMHKYLPDWMTEGIIRRKLSFDYTRTNCTFEGSATTERSGVGGRCTGVLLDEFSKHRQDYEILGQTADTGPCLFIGTHYGMDTAFCELTQRPDMAKEVMHWSQHPEKKKGLYRSVQKMGMPDIIDTAYHFPEDYRFILDGSPTGGPYPGLRSPWYDAECRERDNVRDVAMHLDINPTGSVSQFFSPLLIRELQEETCRQPYFEGFVIFDREQGHVLELVQSPGGPLKMWLHLNHKGEVVPDLFGFGADVATGTGGRGSTNSCLCGLRYRTGEKILEYADPNIDPKDFASLSVALGWFFKSETGEGAELIWESNGPGHKFGKQVLELGYRNIYWRRDETNPLGGPSVKVANPGWVSSTKNIRILMEDYLSGLRSRKFINRSRDALEECLYWAYTPIGIKHSGANSGNDPSGAGVNHGDRSVADGLVWLLGRGRGAQLQREEETRIIPGTLAWRRALHEMAERETAEW